MLVDWTIGREYVLAGLRGSSLGGRKLVLQIVDDR
jgi:hypothetical protein